MQQLICMSHVLCICRQQTCDSYFLPLWSNGDKLMFSEKCHSIRMKIGSKNAYFNWKNTPLLNANKIYLVYILFPFARCFCSFLIALFQNRASSVSVVCLNHLLPVIPRYFHSRFPIIVFSCVNTFAIYSFSNGTF